MHHSVPKHLALPPSQSVPYNIRWNEVYFQPDNLMNHRLNSLTSPVHRYLPYTEARLPLHNTMPFLSNTLRSSTYPSPASIPRIYFILPYLCNKHPLASMSIVATSPEAECNEEGVHYSGLQANHPLEVMPNSPDGQAIAHFQLLYPQPMLPNSSDATVNLMRLLVRNSEFLKIGRK